MLDRAVDHVTTWGELILALGGAIMALWYGAKRVYNIAKTVDLVLEAVGTNGKQAEAALEEIKLIRKQVFPNGGGSLADQVAEIKQRVQVLEHGGYADHPINRAPSRGTDASGTGRDSPANVHTDTKA